MMEEEERKVYSLWCSEINLCRISDETSQRIFEYSHNLKMETRDWIENRNRDKLKERNVEYYEDIKG